MQLQKIGGYASIVNGLLMLFFLVLLVFLLPGLGLVGPSDWNDPVKCIAAGSRSPATFSFMDLGYVLLGITFVPLVLALQERMETAKNLMNLAVIGASISAALCFGTGLVGITGFPPIFSAKDISAYRALSATTFGLGIAADHAFGWALLLSGWAAFKTGKLSRSLSFLLTLMGIVWIIYFLSYGHALYAPLVLVGLLVTFVTELWLGVVLLRNKN